MSEAVPMTRSLGIDVELEFSDLTILKTWIGITGTNLVIVGMSLHDNVVRTRLA
jgi:hypothetical protein